MAKATLIYDSYGAAEAAPLQRNDLFSTVLESFDDGGHADDYVWPGVLGEDKLAGAVAHGGELVWVGEKLE